MSVSIGGNSTVDQTRQALPTDVMLEPIVMMTADAGQYRLRLRWTYTGERPGQWLVARLQLTPAEGQQYTYFGDPQQLAASSSEYLSPILRRGELAKFMFAAEVYRSNEPPMDGKMIYYTIQVDLRDL